MLSAQAGLLASDAANSTTDTDTVRIPFTISSLNVAETRFGTFTSYAKKHLDHTVPLPGGANHPDRIAFVMRIAIKVRTCHDQNGSSGDKHCPRAASGLLTTGEGFYALVEKVISKLRLPSGD